jgi:hypothetical protein
MEGLEITTSSTQSVIVELMKELVSESFHRLYLNPLDAARARIPLGVGKAVACFLPSFSTELPLVQKPFKTDIRPQQI